MLARSTGRKSGGGQRVSVAARTQRCTILHELAHECIRSIRNRTYIAKVGSRRLRRLHCASSSCALRVRRHASHHDGERLQARLLDALHSLVLPDGCYCSLHRPSSHNRATALRVSAQLRYRQQRLFRHACGCGTALHGIEHCVDTASRNHTGIALLPAREGGQTAAGVLHCSGTAASA